MRASWRRDLDRTDTAERASNIMCPICENHVWTYAPGKSYVVYNHENYHPDCLKAESGLTPLTPDRPAITAGQEDEPSRQVEDTSSKEV